MIELTKGANAPVPQDRVNVVLSWGGDLDLDLAALLCTHAGRVRSDEDFVFYNQPVHRSNAVSHRGKLRGPVSTETVEVNLALIEPDIDKVVLSGSMDRGCFGQLSTISVAVEDSEGGVPLLSFAIPDASVETAMIVGELYRRNGTWKFRAVGQGYSSGLRGVATDFGISVDAGPSDSHSVDNAQHQPEYPSVPTYPEAAPYTPAAATYPPQAAPYPQGSPTAPGQPCQMQPPAQVSSPDVSGQITSLAEFRDRSLAGKTRKARNAWASAWNTVAQAMPDGEQALAVVFAHEWESFDGTLTQGEIVWSGELMLTERRFVQIRPDGIGQIRLSEVGGYNYHEFRYGITKVACTLVLTSGARQSHVFSLPDKAKESRAFMAAVKSVMNSQPAVRFD